MTTVYKIRRKSDGLFSTGGAWPQFKTKGKQWPTRAGLHAHFNIVFGRGGQSDRYADCEIVAIEVEEREVAWTPVFQYHAERQRYLQQQATKKEEKRQSRIKKCPSCKQPLKKGCHA